MQVSCQNPDFRSEKELSKRYHASGRPKQKEDAASSKKQRLMNPTECCNHVVIMTELCRDIPT
ncbi:hypothetical protein BBEV_3201 [Salisediminibacterium beveridgei]|uniref:Uncharacterized protein n=1 Tax=Salisediminibacterium beveridgei TaxID=632773 RepID=A0A1D7QZT3_9BACI|nr:hypothetical protein BBEV_3201 [Salisediminibacterium beveridgei]